MTALLAKAFGPDRCAMLAIMPAEEDGPELLIVEPLRLVHGPQHWAARAAVKRHRARRAG